MNVTSVTDNFRSCLARKASSNECLIALRPLIQRAKVDRDALIALLECLPGPASEDTALRSAIVEQLGDLVSVMAQLLELNLDRARPDRGWRLECAQSMACRALADMGPAASAAIPALVSHAKRYPHTEVNVMAIGKIGDRAVVRQLVEWTYLQEGSYDRKRTESAYGALRALGPEGIAGLLELADSDDDYQRVRALLNLLDNTAFPRDQVLPLMARELQRTRHVQCRELLERALAQSDS